MAHTTKVGKFVFVHNGDHSGDVRIVTGAARVGDEHREMTVPMVALAEFVGGAVRDRLIDGLERMDGVDVLNAVLKPVGGLTPLFAKGGS